MYSQETVHPPTRITDLLNPVGGPEPIHRLKPIPSERRQTNVLPGFAMIERAADGPGPPDCTLPPVVHMSASRPAADDTLSSPHNYESSPPRQTYDGQQQAQYHLRAASWDSSKGASNGSDHYGAARVLPGLPSSPGRQSSSGTSDGYLQLQCAMLIEPTRSSSIFPPLLRFECGCGSAFHPANGNHATYPHTGSLYEMKQPATPTLPSMSWAAPPLQSAAHAQYGRGHSVGLGPVPHESSSQCLQTSPPPAPAMFGPHVHTPLRGQIALYPSRTMGSAPPLTMSGGGDSQDGKPS